MTQYVENVNNDRNSMTVIPQQFSVNGKLVQGGRFQQLNINHIIKNGFFIVEKKNV